MYDGLKIGDRVEVSRGNKPIAAVRVEKLYDKFAAATIIEEYQDGKIKAGDDIQKPS